MAVYSGTTQGSPARPGNNINVESLYAEQCLSALCVTVNDGEVQRGPATFILCVDVDARGVQQHLDTGSVA